MALNVKFLLSLVVVVNLIAVVTFFSLSETPQLNDTHPPRHSTIYTIFHFEPQFFLPVLALFFIKFEASPD